jgi:hypothetical protein
LVASDLLTISASGIVDHFHAEPPDPGIRTNAAGVLVADSEAAPGLSAGTVRIIPFRDERPPLRAGPYGALLIGSEALGFSTLFAADADAGLGSAMPPTDLVVTRSVADVFGRGFRPGSVLQLRVNDVNTLDNMGQYFVQIDVNDQPASSTPFRYSRLLQVGDLVQEERVAHLTVPALNNLGEIVHGATLESGRELVLRHRAGQDLDRSGHG